ncbi:hypothetical protein DN069_08210 [Streptacidiphilus pinicola]|uniref:Uncharacterized protein n=1 Tax=Streptacidiphilus pinicola TaxID=2219663 RepID=A0A2X0ISB7_9ACTN|nr:maleylpyruvate isomerase family mycothiol-dependent enzyme [Streptacidiphilus pinicola]RAG86151.1 hypothetical protein DN069_08210 [Streptacidiphilus pinicola]
MKELDATPESFALIAAATGRLRSGLAGLTDGDVSAPSLLPGWSRGHVLNHLARQAPALERLLEWARTGVRTPQYASREARDTEIEAGAQRSASALVADIEETAAHLRQAMEELPPQAWETSIRPFTGELCTPRRILVIRLRELELHHVDLDLGYGFGDIPEPALRIILDDVLGYYAEADGAPDLDLRDTAGHPLGSHGSGAPVIRGNPADILAWLSGRTPGTDLESSAPLPELPRWL